MSDEIPPTEPPTESKGRFGFVHWAILLAILGLLVYRQFFGGGPC